MTSYQHEAWYGDNLGSPATANNFGPYTTAGGVGRLLRVRAVISLSAPGIDLSPTASIADVYAWGVQAYITGFTPLVLPADLGGYSYLWSELLASNNFAGPSWSPPTSDVGWMDNRVAYREWRGQVPVGPAVDLYLGYGQTSGATPPLACSWTMEVDYSY